MAYSNVKEYFKKKGHEELVVRHENIIDTVEHAAETLNCKPGQIGKSMTFLLDDGPIMIISAGDYKVSNSKYKEFFHTKAKMIPRDSVNDIIGHEPGGVCPFGIKDNIKVYLDNSCKEYDVLHLAGGDEYTTVSLTLKELEKYSNYLEYIDVCVKIEE